MSSVICNNDILCKAKVACNANIMPPPGESPQQKEQRLKIQKQCIDKFISSHSSKDGTAYKPGELPSKKNKIQYIILIGLIVAGIIIVSNIKIKK